MTVAPGRGLFDTAPRPQAQPVWPDDPWQPPKPRLSGRLAVLLATVGGVAMGLGTPPVQGLLSRWGDLADSGAVWLVGSFVAGLFLRRRPVAAAVAGAAVLAGAVVGYYGGALLFLPGPLSDSLPVVELLWLVTGCLVGPLFGLAGAWVRDDRRWRRLVAVALLGGVFVAEGVAGLITLHSVRDAAIRCALGLAVPLLFGRDVRDQGYGLLVLLPFAAAGTAAFLGFAKMLAWVLLH